jgi:hypothetical protein
MRFSLRELLIAILLIAVSIVALRQANHIWVGILRSGSVFVLSAALIGSVASVGSTRAFWIGFAIAGWLQFLSMILDYCPPFNETTEGISTWLHSKIVTNVPSNAKEDLPFPPGITSYDGGQTWPWPQPDYFRAAFHCVLTGVFAVAGGYLAVWFYSRRDAQAPRRERLPSRNNNSSGDQPAKSE